MRRVAPLLVLLAALAAPSTGLAADARDLAAVRIDAPRPILPWLAPISGTTPGGRWTITSWRFDLRTDRLRIDLVLDLEPHPHELRPGPVVVFSTVVVEQFDREFRERSTWALEVPTSIVLPPCPQAAALCSIPVVVDVEAAALKVAVGGRASVEGARLAFTIVRTFESGALVQVLNPDPPDPGPAFTLGRVRVSHGRLHPNGLLPPDLLVATFPEIGPPPRPNEPPEIDVPAILRDAVHSAPDSTGPDPWVPVSVDLAQTRDAACLGWSLLLVSETGDIVRRRALQDADQAGVRFDAPVARGGSWSLGIDTGAEPERLGEPFLARDDGYAITGELTCSEEAPPAAQVLVHRVGPERAEPIRIEDLLLPLGGVLALAAVVGLAATLRLLRRREE